MSALSMGVEAQHHTVIREDARRYSVRLAKRIIERYGWDTSDTELDEAVTEVTCDISESVRMLNAQGLPPELTVLWGDEAINALQDRLLNESYLRMAARLVGFDPAATGSPQRRKRSE
jgi:hypothetical protein